MRKLFVSGIDGRIHYVILGEKDSEPWSDEEDDGSSDEKYLLQPKGFRLLINKYNLEIVEEVDDTVRYEPRDRVILSKLDELLSATKSASQIEQGKPLNMEDAAQYLGISLRALYKLTSKRRIPYHKAQGRNYFKLEDLQSFLTKDRVDSMDEIIRMARGKGV